MTLEVALIDQILRAAIRHQIYRYVVIQLETGVLHLLGVPSFVLPEGYRGYLQRICRTFARD
jgi:hypothetical protein